jgi:uncharacterized protein with NRDE domain
MCTLVIAHRVPGHAPLVVLANRDEMLDRAARGPGLLATAPARFGGRDEREGGTWCGLSERGLFVGVTNLTLRPPDPTRRSRGLLCLDMLALRDASEVADAAGALGAGAYNGFNLVASDGVRACRVRYLDGAEVAWLEAGVHAVTNWPRGSPGDAKRLLVERRVREAFREASSTAELVAALRGVASTHDGEGDPMASVCCHTPVYGTRCSTIIAVGREPASIEYWHADGAPCSSPFEDCSAAARTVLHG